MRKTKKLNLIYFFCSVFACDEVKRDEKEDVKIESNKSAQLADDEDYINDLIRFQLKNFAFEISLYRYCKLISLYKRIFVASRIRINLQPNINYNYIISLLDYDYQFI